MTSKTLFNKIASKLILILTILCMLCTFAFLFTACNDNSDSNSSSSEPTYSYSEDNSGLLSNGTFSIGTSSIDFTTISSLPRVSVTGWTKSSSMSDVNSGVIDVSDKGWKALIGKLYDDSDFLAYAKSAFGIDKDKVEQALKDAGTEKPTNQEIKDKIIADYFTEKEGQTNYFPNPGKVSANDNKIYMLNNYDKDAIGHGVNQSITSSSNIKLDKGGYYKFTVSLYTTNLKHFSDSDNYGAFIAVNSTLNASSQAQYRIENIKTESEWKEYTIYVEADKTYDTTVTLELGLGADDYGATEGTVFFDNINCVKVDETKDEFKDEFNALSNKSLALEDTQTLVYADTETDLVASKNVAGKYFYSMEFNKYLKNKNDANGDKLTSTVKEYKNVDNNVDISVAKTKSNTNTGNNFGPTAITANNGTASDLDYVIGEALSSKVLTLNNDAYTVTYKSSSFDVQPKSYVYVEFYVKNQLNKLGSTDITFDVYEDLNKTGVPDAKYKSKAVTTVSEASEDWVKVGLLLSNNFETGNRSFIVEIVVGPTDVATATTAPDYASGTVSITNPLVASGLLDQYADDDKTIENDNYHILSLLRGTANSSIALYAGMQQDFAEDSTNESYSLKYSANDIGEIIKRPVSPINYTGVSYSHAYINVNSENVSINDRENGNSAGSYAGLINTKYVDNSDFKLKNIKTALNFTEGDDNIQPLMIYNAVKDSYGYIGSDKSISPSSYAKISVSVRVVGDAVAYVYLVDVADADKSVMLFDEENVISSNSTKEMFIKVTSNMMNDDGWVTVSFYVATGKTMKDFRIELWNGARNAVVDKEDNKSQGFVFFNNIDIVTTGAFTEPTKVADAFTISGNPLFDIGLGIEDSIVEYTRKLTELEDKFNAEQTDQSKLVSYDPTIVWAKDDANIYAIFNTIDPVEVDPYDSESEDEEETTESGCTAQTDPATFWLSFSSIILGVVLVLAILMLIIKNLRRRRKANASDAKSHYKVVSRSRVHKPTVKEDLEQDTDSDDTVEDVEETVEEVIEEVEETENVETEEQSEDYIYGDVQDFGDDKE